MKNFVLKVIYEKRLGMFVSDSRHEYGGTDLEQVFAFDHLFPIGECPGTLGRFLCTSQKYMVGVST